MLIEAQEPFKGYKVYKVFHEKQGRYYAQLKNIYTSSRTTITYAKYLMCVKLKRILCSEEEVDHIDGNKLNDNIDNLQILSRKNHVKKSTKGETYIECICDMCEVKFLRTKQRANHTRDKNKKCFCSRACASIFLMK